MRRLVYLIILMFSFFTFSQVFWENVFITSLMPNTDNDTNDEYIEITNFSINPLSLSWFSLKDKSGKIFVFGEINLNPSESKKFYRPETMILFNNTDEELWFFDKLWNQADYFKYSTSSKNVSIITGHSGITNSNSWEVLTNSGESNSWTILTNSGEILNNSWVISSWTIFEPFFISTWTILDITSSWAQLNNVTFSWIASVYLNYASSGQVLTWNIVLTNDNYVFSSLNSQTNYFYELNLVNSSWNIVQSSSWNFVTLSSVNTWIIQNQPPQALKMYYYDSNSNQKIDTLEVEFNNSLTGVLIFDKIKFYSNTWWFSSSRIDNKSWLEMLENYSISWSILSLFLKEQDNLKDNLNITNTTTSDLRLKSLSGIWIKDIYWVEIPNFSLTTSFDNYKNVFKRDITQSWSLFSTGNLADSWVVSNSWTDSQTGTQNSWTILTISNWTSLFKAEIPNIIYVLQQPSYIIPKDQNNLVYECDNTKADCKINLNLESSFDSSLKESNYICSINYWNWKIIDSCNPVTEIITRWTFFINLKIIDKNDSSNFKEKILKIENPQSSLIIPEPIISVQSGFWDDLMCHKTDCSVNVTWEKSFQNYSNPKLACLWDFGGWSYAEWTQNKCNPWYVHYWVGNYVIKLKIFEAWNENNFKESIFKFSNYWNLSKEQVEKLQEIPKENVAPVAKIKLQWTIGKAKIQEWNIVFCVWIDECSINFDWSESYDLNWDKLEYFWDFGNWETDKSKNPKSIKFLSWSYNVILAVKDTKWLKWEDYFFVKFLSKKEEELKQIKKIEKKKIEKPIKIKESTEFEQIFRNLIKETTNDISFENSFLKMINSLEKEDNKIELKILKIKEKLEKISIKLQWKIGKNLKLLWGKIYCSTKKFCNINLSLSWSKISSAKYVWNLPNWQIFEWSNPKGISLAPWKYKAILAIMSEDWELFWKEEIEILVSKILSKPKKPKKVAKLKKPKSSFFQVTYADSWKKWKLENFQSINNNEIVGITWILCIFGWFLLNIWKRKIFFV